LEKQLEVQPPAIQTLPKETKKLLKEYKNDAREEYIRLVTI